MLYSYTLIRENLLHLLVELSSSSSYSSSSHSGPTRNPLPYPHNTGSASTASPLLGKTDDQDRVIMAGLFRPIKYAIKGYDFYRTLVLEATENDDNGPYPSQINFIVKRSRDFPEAPAVMMEIIRERLEDRGKKWRRPLKALILLEHCIREGPDEFLELGASSVRAIRDLHEIQFVNKNGTDAAVVVRDKAKEMVSWIQEQSRARQERIQHEELEEELRKEDLRQQRLQQAMKLRQGRGSGPSDDVEPPSYSKVVELDAELQSEEMRQERLRLAAQLRAEKGPPSTEVELDGSPPGPSDHGIANDISTGGKV